MKTTLTVDIALDVADTAAADRFETALLGWLRDKPEVAGLATATHADLNGAAWRRSREEAFASPRHNPFGRAG